MSATARKKPAPPKADRRPYKEAADMRDGLLALHAAIKEDLGPVVDHAHMLYSPTRAEELTKMDGMKRALDVREIGISPLMVRMWELQMAAEKVRDAAKRVLVAQVGAASARRFDGWRRGQWLGSPTYRNQIEIEREKQRRARRVKAA